MTFDLEIEEIPLKNQAEFLKQMQRQKNNSSKQEGTNPYDRVPGPPQINFALFFNFFLQI